MASNFTTADLPKPVILAPLDYEATFQLRLNDFVERMKAAGIDYDLAMLQTDPGVIAAQSAAYGDTYYVARLNDMAQVALLASFAEKSDLDLHAIRAGLTRDDGETDEALRQRIRLAYKGKSAAGPDDYYKSRARNFDSDIRDVAVRAETRNSSDRVLILSVLTASNGGAPSPELLAGLTASLNDPTFRQRGITVEVEGAVVITKDVRAIVTLYPEAIEPEDGAAVLRAQFAKDQALGFDLTDSYVKKFLHVAGAQKVTLIGWADAIVGPEQAIRLGDVDVQFERLAA